MTEAILTALLLLACLATVLTWADRREQRRTAEPPDEGTRLAFDWDRVQFRVPIKPLDTSRFPIVIGDI